MSGWGTISGTCYFNVFKLLDYYILFVEAAASITLGMLPYNSLTTVNAYLPRPAAHRVTEQRPTGKVNLDVRARHQSLRRVVRV